MHALAPQPLAIVLEDVSTHALLARRHLEASGFEVVVYDHLQPMLAAARSELVKAEARPVLVLADCKGIAPERPDVEGTAALAVLADEMHRGNLRMALLVAISSEPTEDRYAEAATAGCRFFLEKPMDEQTAAMLAQLVAAPSYELPDRSGAMRAFHAVARRTIGLLEQMRAEVWTSADAYALLKAVTNFHLQDRAQPEGQPRTSAESRIVQLGGMARTRQRLRAAANMLEHPYNLILLSYLDHPDWSSDQHITALQMQRSTFHHYRKALPDVLARVLTG